MISLDLMRQYVQAADELGEAKRALADAEKRVEQARRAVERLQPKMQGVAPSVLDTEMASTQTAPKSFAGTRTDEQIRAFALARNRKVRGEGTLAILRAMPGTLPELVDRTGMKKTSVSTMIARLQNDGLVAKSGEKAIPGYESRTAAVYDLDE